MTRDEVLAAVELAACEHDAHAVGLRLVDKALAATPTTSPSPSRPRGRRRDERAT